MRVSLPTSGREMIQIETQQPCMMAAEEVEELDVATAAVKLLAESKKKKEILSNGPTSGKINDADDA